MNEYDIEAIASMQAGWAADQADRDRLRDISADLLAALKDADACIQEEINLSNYDHQAVCRIAAMWDEAHGIIQAAIAKASAEGKTDDNEKG